MPFLHCSRECTNVIRLFVFSRDGRTHSLNGCLMPGYRFDIHEPFLQSKEYDASILTRTLIWNFLLDVSFSISITANIFHVRSNKRSHRRHVYLQWRIVQAAMNQLRLSLLISNQLIATISVDSWTYRVRWKKIHYRQWMNVFILLSNRRMKKNSIDESLPVTVSTPSTRRLISCFDLQSMFI